MSIRAIVRFVAIAACAMVFSSAPHAARAAEGPHDPHDLWYVIELAGKRSGHMRTTQSTRDGLIITRTETSLAIKRGDGGGAMTISVIAEFEETADGKPVRSVTTATIGAAPVTTTIVFLPDKIEQTTASGAGEPTVITAPLPEGVWLTPAAAAEFVRKRLEADAKEIVVRTLEPSMGLTPIVTTHKVLERTTAEGLGRTIPALKVSTTIDRMPGVTSESYLDLSGQAIRTSVNLGGLPMTIIAADKDLALSKVDPPELMKSTLVKPDKPIANARTARRAVYLLSVDAGELSEIASGGVQKAIRVSPSEVRVTVDLDDNVPCRFGPHDQKLALAPSTLITSNDEQVKALVARIDRVANSTPAARAEAMRSLVFSHIRKKSLGVGFASAADVARTKEGDCSEHGVLLAAMLRADGIPSRVVSGLVYVDEFLGAEGVFGYHMWTQGLFEDADGTARWVDLDATLGPLAVCDATHIALVNSFLDDDNGMNSMVSLAGLLGRLKIKVEEIK